MVVGYMVVGRFLVEGWYRIYVLESLCGYKVIGYFLGFEKEIVFTYENVYRV